MLSLKGGQEESAIVPIGLDLPLCKDMLAGRYSRQFTLPLVEIKTRRIAGYVHATCLRRVMLLSESWGCHDLNLSSDRTKTLVVCLIKHAIIRIPTSQSVIIGLKPPSGSFGNVIVNP